MPTHRTHKFLASPEGCGLEAAGPPRHQPAMWTKFLGGRRWYSPILDPWDVESTSKIGFIMHLAHTANRNGCGEHVGIICQSPPRLQE